MSLRFVKPSIDTLKVRGQKSPCVHVRSLLSHLVREVKQILLEQVIAKEYPAGSQSKKGSMAEPENGAVPLQMGKKLVEEALQ
jgi:hypothetical protein